MSQFLKLTGTQPWQFNAEFLVSNLGTIVEGTSEHLAVQIPEIESVIGGNLDGFPADKWLLSSGVQKLIRRGRAEQAVRIALALHALDPAYLPRRLPTIAFEDISIGDLQACFDTLQIFGTQRFSSGMSDRDQRRLVANLVYRLARAVKSRTACDILCLARTVPEFLTVATKMASSSASLVKIAADRGAPATKRAMALHLLIGLSVQEGRQYRTFSRFNAEALTAVAKKLALPPAIGWMLIKGRNTSGLAAMLPLALEAANGTAVQIKHLEDLACNAAERPILGVPACAADQHTRVGKAVMAEFAKVLKQKYPRLFESVPGVRKLLGMAIFHAEGSKLDRWLENKTVAKYRDQIEQSELQALGLPDPAFRQKLYDVLHDERELLWQIRTECLTTAFRVHK